MVAVKMLTPSRPMQTAEPKRKLDLMLSKLTATSVSCVLLC